MILTSVPHMCTETRPYILSFIRTVRDGEIAYSRPAECLRRQRHPTGKQDVGREYVAHFPLSGD